MVRGADPTENRSLRLFVFEQPVVEVLVFVDGAEVRIGEFFAGGEFPFGFSFEDTFERAEDAGVGGDGPVGNLGDRFGAARRGEAAAGEDGGDGGEFVGGVDRHLPGGGAAFIQSRGVDARLVYVHRFT